MGLSVIVPVYNAELTLERCMESILNQTYEDFEVILVDDGSIDKSSALCDEYAKRDNRVTVVHIKNSGSFQARKIGAGRATGSILTFADSDDWLDGNTFETVMRLFLKYEPDILAYTYVCSGGKTENHFYEEGLYCGEEIRKQIIPGMMYDSFLGRRRLNPSLCCKLIKRKLYEEVTALVEDRITLGEDAVVTYPAVCRAESIYICNRGLYHYSNNVSSCTHTYPWERVKEVKSFQENIYHLFNKVGMLAQMRAQAENYMRSFLSMMVENWYGISLSSVSFSFPYGRIEKGAKVFIYGAGSVGKSYINGLMLTDYAKIAGWADKNYGSMKAYNGVNIMAPEQIIGKEYDVLLIAVWDEAISNEIAEDLIRNGIPKEKIVWIKPLRII